MMNGKLTDIDLEKVTGGMLDITSKSTLSNAFNCLQDKLRGFYGPGYKGNTTYKQFDTTIADASHRIFSTIGTLEGKQKALGNLSDLLNSSGALNDPEISSIWNAICENYFKY